MNLTRFKELAVSFIGKVPIISGLADCHSRDHAEAIREFWPRLLLSTMPLWLGAYVVAGLKSSSVSYLQAFLGNISNGELFLYSTSTLAPIFYIALVDPPGAKAFPSRLNHILLVFVIVLLSAVSFGLQKAGHELEPLFSYTTSCALYVISLALLYLATVYKNRRLPRVTEKDLQKNERDFSEQFREQNQIGSGLEI